MILTIDAMPFNPADGPRWLGSKSVPRRRRASAPADSFAAIARRAWIGHSAPVRISIIVPAFNEEKLLPATLRSIQAARPAFHDQDWETELIVCDNNSTDRTAAIARAEGAEVVFEPVNQIARARNTGAAAADGDWLVFVDADSHPSRGLFAQVADAIRSGRCLAGGATVRMDEFMASAWVMTELWNGISRACRWCAGSFIFCEAATFRAVGGFSPELYISEEIDLSKRLKAYGKARGRKVVIITSPRLITSARKMHLCSPLEYLQLLWRLIVGRGQALKRREECAIWYDGRR
jgi:glycosyltransferase involved in cell wall biosynthesis